ncbi:hypothetical protein [Levilactobacillus brevis]|uniref:hypothetical protein n=1 Tax=Levilactobacillus brevis TaxID=1580 RepID=UPI00117A0E9C|nr:hypothetical protein [Levilactobacillus brevis]MBS1006947.1 hypothetical protein [Levilactobacillus brevis]
MVQIQFWRTPAFYFSLIATFLSLYAAINTWIYRHKKPIVIVNWANQITKQINCSLTLFNPSSNAISITSIELVQSSKRFNNAQWPVKLVSQKVSKVFSTEFPINIPSYQAANIVTAFQFLDNDISIKSSCELNIHYGDKTLSKRYILQKFNIDFEKMIIIMESKFH